MFRRLFLLALPLLGCTRLLGAPVPMPSLKDPLPAPETARCLLVFLPGVIDRDTTFRDKGFVDDVRKRGLKVDAVAADSTIGYYVRGIDASRLEHDVVLPALTKRYEQVWMVGVSMGGFGALHYASTFTEELDGLLLLSPHLGEESVVQTIRDDAGKLESLGAAQRRPARVHSSGVELVARYRVRRTPRAADLSGLRGRRLRGCEPGAACGRATGFTCAARPRRPLVGFVEAAVGRVSRRLWSSARSCR